MKLPPRFDEGGCWLALTDVAIDVGVELLCAPIEIGWPLSPVLSKNLLSSSRRSISV